MFFVLSKTLSFLVRPLTMIFFSFLLSVIIKKQPWKKRFFWTGFVLLIFFSNDYLATQVMRSWETKTKAFKEMRPFELGIVLTGTTQSFVKPDDRVYFQRGADRVLHTIQLYKLGLIKKILVSGGTGRLLEADEPEADKYKRVMVMAGVKGEDVILENTTRNTYESAVSVKKILDSLHYKAENCLLITSAFHMRRSLACYHKAGLNVETFSTDFYAPPREFMIGSLFLPSLESLIIWDKLSKEWTGFMAYKVAGYI